MDSVNINININLFALVDELDCNEISKQFINYFYKNLVSNPNQLFIDGVIRDSSKIKYNNLIYKGNQFITFLNQLSIGGLNININSFQALECGTRRIDILVNGSFYKNSINQNFTQKFLIANYHDKWFLVNSILILL